MSSAAQEDRRARQAWTTLVEPGDADAGAIIALLGAAPALAALRAGELVDAVIAALVLTSVDVDATRLRPAVARWKPRLGRLDLDAQDARAAASGARFVVPSDPEWQRGWDDLDDHSPLGVWVRGSFATATSAVAVVGARAATGYGEHMTAELVGDLAGRAVSIVSGAAYGIDGAAHRAALATGTHTVAVLAGGVDRVYPAGHAGLLAEVLRSGGAVVSEVPPGAEPTRWRFLARNRLIAAMSAATVVVEAGWRSGSLNTAGHAAALGRPLGAVPGPVTSAASAGCHRLLREYDAVCVTTGAEVAELAGLPTPTPVLPSASGAADVQARIVESMSARVPRGVDDIAARAGTDVARVSTLLGLLELEGIVVRQGEGWCAPGR